MNLKLENLDSNSRSISERLSNLEELTSSIHRMLKQIVMKQTPKARSRPTYLPFKTTADLLAFDFCTDEEYSNFVEYLTSLGGANLTDAAAKYLKSCITIDQDICRRITWTASKKDDAAVALKKTRFAEACRDAMPADKTTLLPPKEDEFAWVMTKALKSAKEGFRRKLKRPAKDIDVDHHIHLLEAQRRRYEEEQQGQQQQQQEEEQRQEIFDDDDFHGYTSNSIDIDQSDDKTIYQQNNGDHRSSGDEMNDDDDEGIYENNDQEDIDYQGNGDEDNTSDIDMFANA